ncbi:MAG: small multi-drug export protein, partial [Actinobacteria bacterium]
ELLAKLLSAALSGAVGLWSGIPAGTALGLPAVLSGTAAVLGNLAAIAVAVLTYGWSGRLVRRFLARRRRGGTSSSKHRERLERIWAGYGLPGVALLSPLLMGAPLGTLLALLLGAPRRRLLRWMVASVVLWGTVLTGAAAFGLSVSGG